ncbi:bifunctional folylpolyglutamate synthase/dihydrofolate synthase [Neptunitalea lumnitzerae]|uniref:Dihydrofolate synthase/folylpolyglutamate synthase n=1 Tax=Neptunitalea lumnitzerae TaxID=2965509 RepID=A0ABQ5ME59_9FLAO|nr:folylpolyglutamate synthase/dihydrofolate synthase family protein [Neptunitalea sp. Y10]GLB47633.1 tetrahydrofolate synthase [Neptunitalea sp. Y10]
MNYQETLDWLFSQLPMFQTQGAVALNNKLDNILQFSAHLGHPENKFKSIHVAGTNGKGSSSHMLASVLQEAGYKVGLYTSPHLKDFRERIRISGKPVSENSVVEFVANHKSYFEANRMSFFEMTVGMAFEMFAQAQVDVAVIEVGLGGRLDSTNIITPLVSLITNIGLDHVDMLGDTLPKIAREKAGIIKPHIPVVISEYHLETAPVFREVAEKNEAPLVFASEMTFKSFKTDLKGIYQKKNIKGVLAVLEQLDEVFDISEEAICNGLLNVVSNTGLLGRWQLLREHPKTICDTAHNVEGLTIVMEQLQEETFDKLHMVLGFVGDKNIDGVLALLPTNAHYYFTKPNNRRALSEVDLKNKAKKFGLVGKTFESVEIAYNAAIESATEKDFVYVGGSNFIVAEIV